MSVKNLLFSDFKIDNNNVTINRSIMNNNPGILLIHATWCGHCKHFMPVYKNLSSRLNQLKDSFTCLTIESEELKKDNGLLSKALGVQGYPTICWVAQDGKIIGQYNGNRNLESILSEVCKVYHHCIEYHN